MSIDYRQSVGWGAPVTEPPTEPNYTPWPVPPGCQLMVHGCHVTGDPEVGWFLMVVDSEVDATDESDSPIAGARPLPARDDGWPHRLEQAAKLAGVDLTGTPGWYVVGLVS